MSGGRVSSTVTLNWPDSVLPWGSVTEHVTTLVPIGKVVPEAGTHVAGIVPSTSSCAEAENVTAAPSGLMASTIWSGGSVSTGTSTLSPTLVLVDGANISAPWYSA